MNVQAASRTLAGVAMPTHTHTYVLLLAGARAAASWPVTSCMPACPTLLSVAVTRKRAYCKAQHPTSPNETNAGQPYPKHWPKPRHPLLLSGSVGDYQTHHRC